MSIASSHPRAEMYIDNRNMIKAGNEIAIVLSAANHKEWDHFVAECGCSYRCLYRASWLLHGNHRTVFSIRRFDILLTSGTVKQKVGQFVIVVTRKIRVFSDQLQLLPGWQHIWPQAMEKVLEEFGSGRYRYGSEWMTGPCRAESLQKFSNIRILSAKKAYLEVVDFSSWADWNSYWAAISKNIIRNYNRYVRESEARGLNVLNVQHSMKFYFDIQRIKSSTIIGKGVASSKVKLHVKGIVRYFALSRHLKFVTCATPAGRLDSFATCVAIGGNTYYLEGGSLKLKAGSGWFTLMSAIRQAYHTSKGGGLFIMGPVDDATSGKAHWIGLEQSRQQCRVVRRPVSVVDFELHAQH